MKREIIVFIVTMCICVLTPCYASYANPEGADPEEGSSFMKSYGNIQYVSQEGSVKIFGEDIALLEANIMSVYEETFAPQSYSGASQMISAENSVETRKHEDEGTFTDEFLVQEERDTLWEFTDENVLQGQEPVSDMIDHVDENDSENEMSKNIFESEEEEVISSISSNSISANSISADISEEK